MSHPTRASAIPVASVFALTSSVVFGSVVGCVGLAGISDFSVDPCFDGCTDGAAQDGTDGTLPDGSVPDGNVADGNTEKDAGLDAPPPPSPGLSTITLPGTGVPVGKIIIATVTAKNDIGDPIPRAGSKVVLSASGGTSVVSFGTVIDNGNGTYSAPITGVTEGTPLSVTAKLDGAALTTPPASLRVANRVSTNLTFAIDAEDADGAGHFGGAGCPGAGMTTWTDTSANAFGGSLVGFVDPCGGAGGSGWGGAGTPDDPRRMSFDGVDDFVTFGPVNTLSGKQTILAWVRKTGVGTPGITGTSDGFGGTSGLPSVLPIVAKGTSEAEADNIDINFHLSITTTGKIASDYEHFVSSSPMNSPNHPMQGTTVVANNEWRIIGFTLDTSVPKRTIWLDAVADATTVPATNTPSTGSANPLTIGAANQSGLGGFNADRGRFQGDVAIVLTYDRALTQAEIEKNCHAFSARFHMTTCPH